VSRISTRIDVPEHKCVRRSCIWLSVEFANILITALARCGLGGEHRALARAAPLITPSKPEQLRGPASPSPNSYKNG
jgi:hypothetical protein